MIKPMRVAWTADATADATTGATGVDLSNAGEHYVVSNLSTTETLYWKLGDGVQSRTAANNTDGTRMALGPGQSAVYSRSDNQIKIYLYAAATAAVWLATGSGM